MGGCPSRSSSRFYTWTFTFLNLYWRSTGQPTFKFKAVRWWHIMIVYYPNVTANRTSNGLHNISTWAYQWKINFNPDTSKQVQEVLFGRMLKVTAHPQLVFNNNPVHETATKKHLGMFLDFKLHFQEHLRICSI